MSGRPIFRRLSLILPCLMRKKPTLFPNLIRKRLPEGPTLLMLPDPEAATVAIQAWLPAGSSSEREEEAGLAHFLEHMIFKGSRRLGVGELAARVEAAGGDINAYTMSDATYYHLTCLAENAGDCLADLADAIWWPHFAEEEVVRERGVILAEIDRATDQPDQMLQEHLFRKAYGKAHPYGRPIVGSRASVRGFDRKALGRFHRRSYNPAHAVIVLAGNVPEKMARTVIRESLRTRRPRTGKSEKSPRRFLPASPEGRGPRIVCLHGRSGLAHLEIAFSVPPFRHPDAPALEALAMILGMGESSRLYHRLCVKRPIMHDVSADIFFSSGEGLFFLGGIADPGRVEAASAGIVGIAREIAGDAPPTGEEFDRAFHNFRSDLEFRRETASGVARIAGYAELLAGNARFAEKYLERFMRVGPADVQRVARTYLHPDGMTAGAFIPHSGNGRMNTKVIRAAIRNGWNGQFSLSSGTETPGENGAGASKKGPLKPLPMRGGTVRTRNRIYEARLPGGGRLVMLPCGSAKVIALRAVFLGGQRLEGSNQAGLHSLMSKVAAQATRSIPSEEMSRRVDGLAATIEGFSGRNSIGISASGISAVAPVLLEMFSDILAEPAFHKNDIALAAREMRAERRSDRDDLGHLSRLRVMSLLYGVHPFGRHPLGDPRIIATLDDRTLRREWRRWTTPRNLVLAVAGDVDPGDMEMRLKRLLRPWAKKAPHTRLPLPPPPPVPPERGRSRRYSERGTTQSHIHLSFLGVSFHDPRRYALSVLTTALGSQGGGVFFELRERRGLAYAVHVSSEEALDPGPVSFYAATAPEFEDEVIEIMQSEIRRVQEVGLHPDEIERAKAYLVGEHLRTHQRAGSRASELAFDLLYGLKREGPEAFKERVQSVRPEEIQAVARDLLEIGKGCLVRIGPPATQNRKR